MSNQKGKAVYFVSVGEPLACLGPQTTAFVV